MGQTKKPRKAYRPRKINKQSHVMAILGAAWLDDAEIAHRTSVIRAAVDAVCRGAGDTGHWRTLFDAVNILDALGELGLASVSGIHDVMTSIEAAIDRRRMTGSPALTADERKAMRDLADAYLGALPHLTNSDLMRAEDLVAVTVRRALAGWTPPGMVIVDAAPLEASPVKNCGGPSVAMPNDRIQPRR